jgi:dolichol-phosphate mannosyltransferase
MIVIVLPAYNEAEAIPRLLRRIDETARTMTQPCTVLVIDDGSSDDTAARAEAFASPTLPVRVIRHSSNRGLHGAVDTGLREAAAITGDPDWIVLMDSDDTHPPRLIPGMIAKGTAGADLIIASRFQPGAVWHGRTWDRILFSYGVSTMFRVMWPMRNVRDYTCGYRAYRASLVRRALERWGDDLVSEHSFACMPDLLWKLHVLEPVVAEVPLELHYDRKPGPSKCRLLGRSGAPSFCCSNGGSAGERVGRCRDAARGHQAGAGDPRAAITPSRARARGGYRATPRVARPGAFGVRYPARR